MCSSSAQLPVGVIGLGSMGMGMALSLVNAGFECYGCDVNQAALKSFAEAGGLVADGPAEIARRCERIIVVVVNADQVDTVLFGENGAFEHMAPGSIVMVSVTVDPDYARALAIKLETRKIRMLDAPISGGALKAVEGALTVMGSGSDAAFDEFADIMDAITEKLYRIGPDIGQGSTVKVVNQLLAGVHIAAAAEAMALGIKAGADPEILYEVISNSAGSSWMFQNRVPHILEGDYNPLSAVNIFIKDLGIVLDTGKGNNMSLPVSAIAHQMFLAAGSAGYGPEDDSAVIKVYRDLAGFQLPGDADSK